MFSIASNGLFHIGVVRRPIVPITANICRLKHMSTSISMRANSRLERELLVPFGFLLRYAVVVLSCRRCR